MGGPLAPLLTFGLEVLVEGTWKGQQCIQHGRLAIVPQCYLQLAPFLLASPSSGWYLFIWPCCGDSEGMLGHTTAGQAIQRSPILVVNHLWSPGVKVGYTCSSQIHSF